MPYTFDGPNKLIIMDAGTVELDVLDVYSRYKDWLIAGSMQFEPAFATMPGAAPSVSVPRAIGGDTIDAGAGTSIPFYAFLTNGWRCRPQEASHTLAVTQGILLVNGGGDPFVDTIGAYTVRINYQQPVQAITVGGSSPTVIADAVWEADLTAYTVTDTAGNVLYRAYRTVRTMLGFRV